MSTDTTLADFQSEQHDDTDGERDERSSNRNASIRNRPNWTPQASDEPDTGMQARCEVCDALVSQQFARVFGDNDDRLPNGCLECSTVREIGGRTDSYGAGVGVGGAGL